MCSLYFVLSIASVCFDLSNYLFISYLSSYSKQEFKTLATEITSLFLRFATLFLCTESVEHKKIWWELRWCPKPKTSRHQSTVNTQPEIPIIPNFMHYFWRFQQQTVSECFEGDMDLKNTCTFHSKMSYFRHKKHSLAFLIFVHTQPLNRL